MLTEPSAVMSPRRSFTLVELLVVIAIIGLLIGIVVPVIAKARASARRTACASNLRQIGVAMRAYIGNTGDRYPYASSVPSIDPTPIDGNTPIYIADVLRSDLANQTDVFRCPNDPGDTQREPPNVGKSYFQTERSSYEYQVRLGGQTLEEHARHIQDFLGVTVNPNDIWTFRDYFNFHAPGGSPGSRRYLYGDGRVTDFEM